MNQHAELLSLIEHTGPFLTEPVLDRIFPQGIDPIEHGTGARLRSAYTEWTESQQRCDAESPKIHAAWIDMMLREGLDYEERSLRRGSAVSVEITVDLAEHNEKISPEIALVNPEGRTNAGKARLLLAIWPFGQDLVGQTKDLKWAASPIERMTVLCRTTGTQLGLVTNGERWTLVDAREGQSVAIASWYARLWFQEPLTLQGFLSLLGARRFFGVPEGDTIESLFVESSNYQEEVTDQLGLQVRQAVEVLVQALDRADKDRKRELLKDVDPVRLYDAALTVMMRLVFLFCAEERGLLLLEDEIYDSCYAVSTLRGLLREQADKIGLEVLERRHDAWARLLAIFRAIYGGIYHENLRLPALGSSLFDPDRYPFLEGRGEKTSWRDTPAFPLPIDNRTVLHLLESLQLLRRRGGRGFQEARRLSFRALDIEQIGHVYEGLLDHVAVRVKSPTLGLVGAKRQETEISLEDLEENRKKGETKLIEFLNEETGRSINALKNDLHRKPTEDIRSALVTACGNDEELLERVLPFHALIRDDVWGYPVVYQTGSFMVTGGADRRSTGTHYTPKSFTEEIVKETLIPLVYEGPSEGRLRHAWKLKSAAELLDLKICDMAMGSAAFLVQVCEWLGERIVEAWMLAEEIGQIVLADGNVVQNASGLETLARDKDERLLVAKRLIAEKCIYGVDINPMAVELAKLSIWLVTMAKGRPFGFLDHNLRCGDSLLGINRLDQLTNLSMEPDDKFQGRLFGQKIEVAVKEALQIRKKLREIQILDINDIDIMKRLDREAREKLENVELIADAMIGEVLCHGSNEKALEAALSVLSGLADELILGKVGVKERILKTAQATLACGLPAGTPPRMPFHWAVEFPEVFAREGFDAIVGNPPFLGGTRISEVCGDEYNLFLALLWPPASRKTDLCAFFFRNAYLLLRSRGSLGMLATNTISQGTTRKGGLEIILTNGGKIVRAWPSFKWPGTASVIASAVWIFKGEWGAKCVVDNNLCAYIDSLLTAQTGAMAHPARLIKNMNKSFDGSCIYGRGFILEPSLAKDFIKRSPRNQEVVKPYIGGEELNNEPDLRPTRWIIDMGERTLKEAESYVDVFTYIKKNVMPERLDMDKKKYPRLVDQWWKYWHSRLELYNGIRTFGLGRVLARARISDHHMVAFLPPNIVYSEQLVVFLLSTFQEFSVIQSSIHDIWSRRYASTMKTDVRYTPSDCFDTFPFPKSKDELEKCGAQYYEHRSQIMLSKKQGLTKIYNAFHSADNCSAEIKRLRILHMYIDKAVASAYGWTDLDLGHDFYETKQSIRYTISESARQEILDRLLALNYLRYEEEVKQGMHDKTKSKTRSGSKKLASQGQLEFFKGQEK